MAEVLLVSLVFPPDNVSTAQIMGDLALDLQSRGHRVTVLSTTPHYNRDVEAERRQPLRRKWGRLLRVSDYRGVRVYHAAMPRKGPSILVRVLGWAGFHSLSILAGLFVVPKADVIIAPSPPLTVGLCAWLLGRYHRAPYIYNVQEIYPDIAIKLGVLRNRWLIGVLYGLEGFIYRRAARITVIADRMRRRLIEKGVASDHVVLIPNFVDLDVLQPEPRINAFSREHGVDTRYVVSYAGNLGPAQGISTLLDAAALLRNEANICVMLIGDGILWSDCERRIVHERLTNVRLVPYQSFSRVPQIYGASDLCLVSQAASTGCDAVPSKVYRIMACARPVLAATDSESDLARLVGDAGCGAVVVQGSAEALAQAILRAAQAPDVWRRMGEAGRAHVMNHYARLVITRQYHELVESIATSNPARSRAVTTKR